MAHEHNIIDTDNAFTIDPLSRMISKVTGAKVTIMQFDDNSERFTFTIPRYIEGHDMHDSDIIEIHFTNTGTGTSVSNRALYSGIYRIKDKHVSDDEPDILKFSWLVGEESTQLAGTLTFLVKFICYDEPGYKWHTHPCTFINVAAGMNNSDEVVEIHSDVIAGIEKRLEEMANSEETENRFRIIGGQIADLLYKPITVSSFTNNVNTVEIGSTVNSVTLSWKLNKDAVMANIDSTAVDTSQNGSLVLTDLAIKANKTWTLKVSDERETTASKTTAVTFLNGVYYGAAPAGTIDSSFVRSLTRTLRSGKLQSFSANAGASQYIWYCIPTRFGKCTFTVNGFTGGFSLVDTIDFTNASGYAEKYYIYRSDNASLGSTFVTVG
jgi:hypothetical protein